MKVPAKARIIEEDKPRLPSDLSCGLSGAVVDNGDRDFRHFRRLGAVGCRSVQCDAEEQPAYETRRACVWEVGEDGGAVEDGLPIDDLRFTIYDLRFLKDGTAFKDPIGNQQPRGASQTATGGP